MKKTSHAPISAGDRRKTILNSSQNISGFWPGFEPFGPSSRTELGQFWDEDKPRKRYFALAHGGWSSPPLHYEYLTK